MGYVQSKVTVFASVANGGTIVFDSNVTVGNTIIVIGMHSYAGCPPSLSDNLGNTYTRRGNQMNLSGEIFEIFTAPVTTGGACTITASMSCGTFRSLAIVEVSGLASGNPFDQQNGTYTSNATSPFSAGTITPTESGEYVLALFSSGGAIKDFSDGGAGLTERGNNANNDTTIFDKIHTSGAINPNVTFSGTITDCRGIVASFKTAAPVLGWSVPKLGTLVEDATGNFDLIEPAGVAPGDLMVACIAYRGNAAITLPAGWATVATAQNTGDTDATNGIASGVMAYIVRGASAPALTCTRTAGDVVLARVISYSGGSRFPYDTGSANTLGSASATVTTGTITTAEAGELLVAMTAAGDTYLASAFDATDPSTASGATDTTTAPTAGTWIERQDSSTGTGADTGLAIADAIKATAGATGTIQATIAGSAQHVMIVGAFKVAPAPGRIYMSRQAVMRSNLF